MVVGGGEWGRQRDRKWMGTWQTQTQKYIVSTARKDSVKTEADRLFP